MTQSINTQDTIEHLARLHNTMALYVTRRIVRQSYEYDWKDLHLSDTDVDGPTGVKGPISFDDHLRDIRNVCHRLSSHSGQAVSEPAKHAEVIMVVMNCLPDLRAARSHGYRGIANLNTFWECLHAISPDSLPTQVEWIDAHKFLSKIISGSEEALSTSEAIEGDAIVDELDLVLGLSMRPNHCATKAAVTETALFATLGLAAKHLYTLAAHPQDIKGPSFKPNLLLTLGQWTAVLSSAKQDTGYLLTQACIEYQGLSDTQKEKVKKCTPIDMLDRFESYRRADFDFDKDGSEVVSIISSHLTGGTLLQPFIDGPSDLESHQETSHGASTATQEAHTLLDSTTSILAREFAGPMKSAEALMSKIAEKAATDKAKRLKNVDEAIKQDIPVTENSYLGSAALETVSVPGGVQSGSGDPSLVDQATEVSTEDLVRARV